MEIFQILLEGAMRRWVWPFGPRPSGATGAPLGF